MRRGFMALVFVLLAVFFPRSVMADDWFSVSGYVKNFSMFLDSPVSPDESRFSAVNTLRARIKVFVRPKDWFSASTAYEITPKFVSLVSAFQSADFIHPFAYRVADIRNPIWTSGSNSPFSLKQNLDRLFLNFSTARFDITVGRQVISFGTARAINPTDIFAPFSFDTLDKEERAGVPPPV